MFNKSFRVKSFQTFSFFIFLFLFLIFLQTSFASDESDIGFDYEIEDGELFVDIVDEVNGNSIDNPVVDFGTGEFSNAPTVSTGILGTPEESIRIFNYTSEPKWELTLAAEHVDSEWSSIGSSYPYNDLNSAENGRLTVNPEDVRVSSDVFCNYADINKGSESTFERGVIDSVDLLIAPATVPNFCRFDLQEIELTQTVPASQEVGLYSLNMVLTVTSGSTLEPSAPQNLTVDFEDDIATLNWDEPEFIGDLPIIGYQIERQSSPWVVIVANTGSTNTSYVDFDSDISYNYRVTAVTVLGASSYYSDSPDYMISYVSSEGGSVSPSYRKVVGNTSVPGPSIEIDEGYEFLNFSILEGTGYTEFDVETGEAIGVTGDLVIRANFEEIYVFSCGDEVLDERDGQVYSTVQIGTQCWMAENLNYDNDCSDVPYTDSNDGWCGCYPGDTGSCDTYGLVYKRGAIENACPLEWKVPSDDDFKELEIYMGLLEGRLGTHLKKPIWNDYFVNRWLGTNLTGFSLLGGELYFFPEPWAMGQDNAILWTSSTEQETGLRWARRFQGEEYSSNEYSGMIGRHSFGSEWGGYVRCLLEEEVAPVACQEPQGSCYEKQGLYRGILPHSQGWSDPFQFNDACGELIGVSGCPVSQNWSWVEENEIVKDNTTGLLWTKNIENNVEWFDVIAYCENLTFGGRSDWRLPTRNELMQIAPTNHNYGYNCDSSTQSCTGIIGPNNPGSGNDLYGWNSSFATNRSFWSANYADHNDWWYGWRVNLEGGSVDRVTTCSTGALRCVAR